MLGWSDAITTIKLIILFYGPVYSFLKSHLGDQVRNKQLRHITVSACVYQASPRCPPDHLCSDIITAFVSSSRRSKVPMYGMVI